MKPHARNILSLFGFDALGRFLGFVSTTYLARTLGNGAFGVMNLGLAVLSYGLIIASPGVHIIGTRMVSQHTSDVSTILKQVTTLRFVLALCTTAVMTAGTVILVRDVTTAYVVIFYLASLLPFALQLEWFFQGTQRIAALGASRAAGLLVFVLLVIFIVKSEADIILVPAAYFVSAAVNAIVLYFANQKKRTEDRALIKNTPSATVRWSSILRQSLPVGAAVIIGQAVLNLPVLLLGVFATTADIGNFSAASKLIFFLLAIDRAIYVLFYPLVAKSIKSAPLGVGKQVSRILNYVLIVVLPICTGGLVLARPIIVLIFGPAYENSSLLLQILLFYFLFTILNSIFAFVVIAAGNEKRYSAIMVTVSSALIVALVPLTYYWKAAGASCGMAAGECLMMVLMFRQCRASISPRLQFQSIKPAVSALCMGLVIVSLPFTALYVLIPLGMIIYFVSMIVLRGIGKEDLIFLKERFL